MDKTHNWESSLIRVLGDNASHQERIVFWQALGVNEDVLLSLWNNPSANQLLKALAHIMLNKEQATKWIKARNLKKLIHSHQSKLEELELELKAPARLLMAQLRLVDALEDTLEHMAKENMHLIIENGTLKAICILANNESTRMEIDTFGAFRLEMEL